MNKSDLINPLQVFGSSLNSIQAPSRYLGGEYGSIIKSHEDNENLFNFCVAFPDLYEIGMSNLAVKIIYNALNGKEGIRCERVFAPDIDFENLLREKNVPLYTLETGIPLNSLDMIGFSIGYELGITEVLAMLKAGRVPLSTHERKESDPIVIAGGCGVTNPAPIGSFFDAIMIGEAEPVLFDLVEELSLLKKKGASRKELLSLIESKPFMWTKEKCGSSVHLSKFTTSDTQNECILPKKVARRAVQKNFGIEPSVSSYFPLPSIKPVQDHGVVEIMRGCPNGCRFCHAGVYYRPTRAKNKKLIIDEIDHLVFDAGYREVSLNSLSSADFPDISEFLDELNARYKGYNVSFQLPSLKVNSMSLPVLEKLSTVRKSGLTFAVETPDEMWQLSLNKEVYAQHLESIIREAKSKGWSSAKFYFMIGLPVGDYFNEYSSAPSDTLKSEEKVIVDFLLELQKRTRIQCNVNVGVFIPKPHTAYQWVRQITPEEAQKKIDYIYKNLPKGKFKIGKHNLNTTVLEGLLSRGDERVGDLILSAFKKGVRLDAWYEHLRENQEKWEEVFREADWNVKETVYRTWDIDEALPWDGVSLGPSKGFYKKEWKNSISQVLTPKCEVNCNHSCGICTPKEQVKVHSAEEINSISIPVKNRNIVTPPERPVANIPILYRVNFSFTRKDGAEYTAYLSQVEIFHKAIIRSMLPFVFTTGFNPLPRLEFATAMSLGVPSEEEVATAYLYDNILEEDFIQTMNKVLPCIFYINKAQIFPVTTLRKRESLSQGLWGQSYKYKLLEPITKVKFYEFINQNEELKNHDFNFINDTEFNASFASSDKKFRVALEEYFTNKWFNLIKVTKTATLAKPEISGWTAQDENLWRMDNKHFIKESEKSISDKPISYFELYERIAKINAELIEQREILTQKALEYKTEKAYEQ